VPHPHKRLPGAEERAFLRALRLFYRRPELFPQETHAVSRAAGILGFRHPLTSFFRWIAVTCCRWTLALLAVLLLCLDGWGCAGHDGAEIGPDEEPQGFAGWVCGDAGTCTCDGIVRPGGDDLKGLCLEQGPSGGPL
jgi:hypothetical protein